MSMDEEMRRISPHDFLVLRSAPLDSMANGDPEKQPEPVCAGCSGRGFYKEAVPFGHPHFGKLFDCECKQREKAAKLRALLQEKSNIGELRGKTFATFGRYVSGVSEAYSAAKAFAERPVGWLTLFGTYGCGKTHLLAAITNALLDRDVEVYLGVTPDLLDHLRATFGPNSEVRYDELFTRVREVPVLLLDDLGTEAASPWAREKLFQIINYRYNNSLPLVVSTNCQLASIDPRLESRFSDLDLARIITITAKDYRKRERTKKGTAA